MKRAQAYGLAISCLFAVGTPAFATPITFFGMDQKPNVSTAESDLANEQFLQGLDPDVGTEDFEGFENKASGSLTLSFPGSSGALTATLSGQGKVLNKSISGTRAMSGDQLYDTGKGGSFKLAFSDPISAFGFFGTDISDVGSLLRLTLTDTSGATTQLQVTNSGKNRNGNRLFFGFIDPDTQYTDIVFNNTAMMDRFGFDDMTIGDLGQVALPVTDVPAPAGLALFGLSLLGFGLFLRRSRKTD